MEPTITLDDVLAILNEEQITPAEFRILIRSLKLRQMLLVAQSTEAIARQQEQRAIQQAQATVQAAQAAANAAQQELDEFLSSLMQG